MLKLTKKNRPGQFQQALALFFSSLSHSLTLSFSMGPVRLSELQRIAVVEHTHAGSYTVYT